MCDRTTLCSRWARLSIKQVNPHEALAHFTFSAASEQLVGEQFSGQLPGHLIQPHGLTDFQLLWSGGGHQMDTQWAGKVSGYTQLLQLMLKSAPKIGSK